MTAVRAAAVDDVGAMADVAELRRAEYARWEPDFWRPSPTARLAHMPYLSWLVEHERTVALVAESERALEEGDRDRARGEARLVLELKGITSKQRQDARRLMRSAREPQPEPEAPPNVGP